MRCLLSAAAALAVLLLAGCPIPLSKQPLSDAKTSKIDERLLGVWEVDVTSIQEKLGNADGDKTAHYVIERVEDHPHRLSCTHLNDGEPSGDALPLLVTHFGMHQYLSLGGMAGDDKPFALCMYEFTGDDAGKLYLMDGDFVIAQIEAGKIAGEVKREDGKLQGVMLNASTEALRDFVHQHGAAAFDREHPLACKRIKPSIAKD